MRRTDRLRRRIFPVLVFPIEKEMLSQLSRASGLSRGAVVRALILRETASRELVRQTSQEKGTPC
jgi:hypothetical protein